MQRYQVGALNAYALPSAALLCYFRRNWCKKIAAVNSRPALALFRWYGQGQLISWIHGTIAPQSKRFFCDAVLSRKDDLFQAFKVSDLRKHFLPQLWV